MCASIDTLSNHAYLLIWSVYNFQWMDGWMDALTHAQIHDFLSGGVQYHQGVKQFGSRSGPIWV